MEFIENNEKYGIKYDLSKIAKEYKKLKIPKEFDFIDFNRIENIGGLYEKDTLSVHGNHYDHVFCGVRQ